MKKCFAIVLLLPCLALAVLSTDSLNVNHWRAPIYNDGRWGIDITHTNYPGGYWPCPLRNFYVFGSGLWIGAIMGNETLVSVGYDPNSGATEFGPTLCRYWRAGYTDPQDRVYKTPADWPPPLARFPMAPQNRRSDQDLWCCFGDSDPGRHHAPETIPLGVDIALTVHAFADSAASDFFFLRYNVLNNNEYPLNNILIGMLMDADIGWSTDDMVGFILNKLFHVSGDTIRVRNTGFCHDCDNLEPDGSNGADRWQSGTPGMVAVALLASPGDVGLSAFKRFTLDIDPPTDPTRYQELAGYDYRTGIYDPYDSIDNSPNDKRFLEASGPVTIPPHDSAVFWYAVIASPFGDSGEIGPKHDTSELAIRYRDAVRRFQQTVAVQETKHSPRPPVTLRNSIFSLIEPCCIEFEAGRTGVVAVYDRSGRLLRTLTGKSEISWNGTNARGRVQPAGVYFLRVRTPDATTFKVVLRR